MLYQTGSVINERYVVYEAHEGGLGIVYLCIDLKEKDVVALKTLRETYLTNPGRVRRFQEETRIWLDIGCHGAHPNIVELKNFIQIADQPFIIMECVVGESQTELNLIQSSERAEAHPKPASQSVTLSSRLKNGPLALRQALDFAIDICRGMMHANGVVQGGIVHRDLKPDNILVGANHVAKINDFGLARALQTWSASSGGDDGQGTPAYMSPEQWNNEALDSRSDIYAAGCILFEMVVGVPYVQADAYDEFRKAHLTHVFSALPALQPELNAILARCLAKDRTERYPSWAALHDDLVACYRALLNAEPRPIPTTAQVLTAADCVQRALIYFNLRYYPEAITEISAAIRLDPENPLLFDYRASVYATIQDFERALQDINEAIRLDEDLAYSWYVYGLILSEWGQRHLREGNHEDGRRRLEEALEKYNHAETFDIQSVDLYMYRGLSRFLLGDPDAALQDYRRGLDLCDSNPADSDLFFYRARAYAAISRYGEAIDNYREKIKRSPKEDLPYYECAKCYLQREPAQPDEALRLLNEAIELDPKDTDYRVLRGLTHKTLRHYHEALEDFGYVLRDDPNNRLAVRERGWFYYISRRYGPALEDLNRAIELDPTDSEAYLYRGRLYAEMNDLLKADQDFLEAIARAPASHDGYVARALFLLERRPMNMQEILHCLLQADRLSPNNAGIQYVFGLLYLKTERYTEAINYYTRAIRLRGDYSGAYNNRGVAYLMQGRLQQAEQDFQKALAYNPSPITLINLGMIKEQQRQWPEALRFYERAAQLGNPQGLQRLNALRRTMGLRPMALQDPLVRIQQELQDARSLDRMRTIVVQFPYMTEDEFVEALDNPDSPIARILQVLDNQNRVWFYLSISERRR